MPVVRELITKVTLQGDAGSKLQKFGLAVNGVKAALGIMTGAFRAAKSVVFDFTADLAKQGDDLAKTANKIGITAESLQELSFAAQISGSDVGKFTKAIQTMAKNLNDARVKGTGPFMDTMNQLGISVAEFDNLSPDEIFERFADEISRLDDPITQAALAADVFGRSGKDLLPLFKEGGAGIRSLRKEFKELGGGFTDDGAKGAEEFVDAQTRLLTVIESVKIAVGEELFPVLQGVIDQVRLWFQANREIIKQKLLEFVNKAVSAFTRLVPVAGKIFDWFVGVIPHVVSFVEFLGELIEGVGGFENALSLAVTAMVAMKVASAGALGPIGLIMTAFATILPFAIQLGDKLGDIAFGLSEVGKEARILENQHGGKRTKRTGAPSGFATKDIANENARLTRERNRLVEFQRKGGDGVPASVQTKIDSLNSDLRKLEARNEVASKKKKKRDDLFLEAGGVTDSKEQKFKRQQEAGARVRAQLGDGKEASDLVNKVILGKITEEQALGKARNKKKGKGGGKKKRKDPAGAVSDEELLKLIQRAGVSGESLTGLIDGRKIEGGPPPVVTVTINRTDVKMNVTAPVTVSGVPSEIAEDVAQLVEEKQRELLREEFTRAVEEIQSPEAR